ncbi:MAG: molybdopterin-dependent oxidoreductase [Acidobacteriota bacterium]
MSRRRVKGLSRRSFLATAGQTGAMVGLGSLVPGTIATTLAQTPSGIKGKERLIVRSLRPEDLETPVGLLNSFITPNDIFYVRHHMYAAKVDASSWKLVVDGDVERPLTLNLDEVKRLPQANVTVTLECAGNGRAFFDPPVAGIQWEKGAVGTARFAGARLADVLKRAGLKAAGRYVVLDGADKPMGKMPDFVRNVPIEKAMHPDTLIAYAMNGEPLPALHGFPLRAIVPGWEGAYSVKWLQHIQVVPAEHDGFFVKTGYRYPTKRVAPGAAVDPKDMAPLTGLVVKSLITSPIDRASIKVGVVPVSGFAWAGENDVVRVDISTDNGASWVPAALGRERERYSWRQFSYEFKAPVAGFYSIMARATDNKGNVQPIEAQWNPSGYLWNVIDRVRINVEAA